MTTTYQPTAPQVATGRRESDFDAGLATLARGLRLSVADLDDAEIYLLDDFGRGASVDGEIRYRMKTLRALCAIAARSPRPELRDALPELLRAEIDRVAPAMTVEAAFDHETPVPGQADVEQRAFEKNPNPITWRRCVDALRRQLAVTLNALRAVLLARPA